ncbi:SRPBCC domain-containing protein [Streptomyces sp. NPDC005876]|uniref:SRPBCC domain-containing protein n=1 Tax=Streptomyces sp. NPDC005876 TaxID=3157076 RepID=UPI0033F5FE45
MEHEVFVPVPAERLREVLSDPARVAGAVPGLQQDAGAEPVAGRLKVRVGSHSVTYRGTVRVTRGDDGTYAVEGEGAETRGTGTVTLALTLRLADAEGGTAVAYAGTATATGRLTELPADAVAAAGTRLLTRFAENLGAAAQRPADETAPGAATVFDTEVPPPALDPAADPDPAAGPAADPAPAPAPGPAATPAPADQDPPAEAAHARRTMIGRSAEEVDHAPPRGRYAPVPAPEATAAPTSLRWAAPAAALVVASAIVVGRALRRRH